MTNSHRWATKASSQGLDPGLPHGQWGPYSWTSPSAFQGVHWLHRTGEVPELGYEPGAQLRDAAFPRCILIINYKSLLLISLHFFLSAETSPRILNEAGQANSPSSQLIFILNILAETLLVYCFYTSLQGKTVPGRKTHVLAPSCGPVPLAQCLLQRKHSVNIADGRSLSFGHCAILTSAPSLNCHTNNLNCIIIAPK